MGLPFKKINTFFGAILTKCIQVTITERVALLFQDAVIL